MTNEYIYKPFTDGLDPKCSLLFQENYGSGEPSDEMIESILKDIRNKEFNRVIGIGGGTIIDIAKMSFYRRSASPAVMVFMLLHLRLRSFIR